MPTRPHKTTAKNDTPQTGGVKYVRLPSTAFNYGGDLNAFLEQKTPSLYPEHIAKSDNTREAVKRGGSEAVAELTPNGSHPAEGTFTRSLQRSFADTPAEQLAKITAIPEFIPRCTGIFITGHCGSHRHLKATVCGKEWCQHCGKSGSLAHRRRISRWWNKLETFSTVGYMVITVPSELRNEFKDKKVLQEFRRYIKRKLQRTRISGKSQLVITPYIYKTKAGKIRTGIRQKVVGYAQGFIRYHYAGDCAACNGNGCDTCLQTGADREFKPHLNILLPESHIKKEILTKFRNEIAVWFRKRFKMSYLPAGNIHYKYYSRPAQRTHKLKYVTRATFRIYNTEIAEVLHGFHTASSWGKFKVKEPTFTEAAEKGCCKTCMEETGSLEKINWNTKLTCAEAQKIINTYRHVENGYYVGYEDINKIFSG